MMSDLLPVEDECLSGVDIEERGNSLRVASNTPHLISLGCGRLSTAVTIHPLKQGGIVLGSDSSCGIHLQGTGVQPIHCKIENSNGVVTIYPLTGITTLDGDKVENPTRLSQGCTIGIGRSNYLRFNHPAEANLMKSVLPNTRISMAPIQFLQKDNFEIAPQNQTTAQEIKDSQNFPSKNNVPDKYERLKDSLSNPTFNTGHEALNSELQMIGDNVRKKKPPIAPRRMFRDLDTTSNSSNSDQETISSQQSDGTPKSGSIMSKVSKFEFYVKNSQRSSTKNAASNDAWSPKVFSANSATGSITAKDLIGKNVPTNYVNKNHSYSTNDKERINGNSYNGQRIITLNENNAVEAKNCSYSNVMIKSQVGKIDQISKTFDEKKTSQAANSDRLNFRFQTPSPSFNRNPVFNSPTSQNNFKFDSDEAKISGKREELLNEENQKFLEQARIDEILTLCAEYEKQNSSVVPTTPTEKKTHNKIITNGSLPRGYQYNPNIVPTSDGYFRFDTGKYKTGGSPHQMNSPVNTQNIHYGGQVKSSPEGAFPNSIFNFNQPQSTPITSPISDGKPELLPLNTRQFPITELSSPLMIRKVARNAQNSSNYAGNFDHIGNHNFISNNTMNGNLKNGISPYENVMIHGQNVMINASSPTNAYVPRSPNTNSPRTRIKTTYANRNVPQPQHFVFPSPPPSFAGTHPLSINSPGIEKQLSLTEDIPMIDDTEFANELEMRISKLKPENREKAAENHDFILDPLQNINALQRRNFEEIKRDLIADIPELDAIQKDLDRNLAKNTKNSKVENTTVSVNQHYKLDSDSSIDGQHSNQYEPKSFSSDSENHGEDSINVIDEMMNFLNQSQFDKSNASSHPVVSDSSNISNDLSKNNESDTFKTNDTESINDSNQSKDSISNLNESENENPIQKEASEKEIQLQMIIQKNNSEQLESLYLKRKNIMNDMKEIKTEINDLELSRKQSQLELDEFRERIEKLQNGLQVHQDMRKDEVDMVSVSDSEKLNFKLAQEDRQKEMKEMQKRLEEADDHVKRLEKQFSKGRVTLEELRHAQEQQENERKMFEDMEFQHLEKESEFYSRIAKEQNILKNDPFGTCKKIEKMQKLLDELNFEMDLSESQIREKNDNPHIRKLLEKLSNLEKHLCSVNEDINKIKKDVGIYRNNDNFHNIENYKARIKSGDFSPPTSDDDDMNEVKDRIKSSIDQNYTKATVEVHNPIISKSTSMDKTFDSSNLEEKMEKKFTNSVDPMSMSMIVETKSSLQDVCDDSIILDTQKLNKTDVPVTPECEKEKKGFWERNFDSLSRLKNKDKKNHKVIDIMSQSLNENMLYNNEHIESEFGSFEKCNNGKSNSSIKFKDGKVKGDESNKSKMSSFSSLSKIIRRDSLGKKNKETSKNNANDKENINMDTTVEIVNKDEDSLKENKSTKPRYLKNIKTITTDNKYVNKSKTNSNTSPESKGRESSTSPENLDREKLLPPIDPRNKISFRKSAGDEIKKTYKSNDENLVQNLKIPSQDDIDRISKVTLDAPLFTNNSDMNSLGRKTLDSLRELERNRVALLEQKGCEVIENEREKMTELKKRIQNETTLKWEENQLKCARNEANLIANEIYIKNTDQIMKPNFDFNDISNSEYRENSYGIDFDSSCIGDESALDSMSLEKQLRNSQSDSYNSSAYIEDDRSGSRNERQSSPLAGHNGVRPLSEMSDMSSDNGASPQPLMEGPRRSRKTSANSLNNSFIRNRDDIQRPLTRYLPIDKEDLNLRQHIESAGHQVDLCPHVLIDFTSCRGYLHKLGAKFHGWSKRWFVFDRSLRALVYYSDKSEKKPRGGAYFQVIEEVYLDHLNASKSPSPLTTFVVKTRQRRYYLMAPSGPAARIWIDVIFTGAQGYTEYLS